MKYTPLYMVEESVKKIYSKNTNNLGIRPCKKSSKFPLKLLIARTSFKEIDFPFTTLSTLLTYLSSEHSEK